MRFPDQVLRAAPIAGTARNTPHDFLLAEIMREATISDPGWNGGQYVSNTDVEAGLKRQAHIWAVVGFSTEFWKQEVWRALEFTSRDEFITGFLEPYFAPMDPNDLLTQSWNGSAATWPGTPAATWPPRSAGSRPRPSSCPSTRTCCSRSGTAAPSRK